MLYSHLQLLIRFLKKNLPCPHCETSFSSTDIEVVELHDEACVLLISCPECDTEIEVEIVMKDGEVQPSINVVGDGSSVTKEDVDAIAKILSSHKGGLKNLLREE